MEQPVNPTLQAQRRYCWELGVSINAYVIIIVYSRWFVRSLTGPWHTFVVLLPIIPVIFVFAAIVRFILATDELQRRIIVHSLALAGGATALLAATYGLMEDANVPNLSAWWTFTVFMVSWIIAGLFVRRHYQ